MPSRAARYSRAPKPPRGAELAYRIAMRGLVARWREGVRRVVLPIAERIAADPAARTDASDASLDALEQLGSSLAESTTLDRATRGVADKAIRHSKGEFGRLGIKIREAEPSFDGAIKAWRKENVGLVKSLFAGETKKLSKILAEGESRRFESLAREIEERLDVTQRKAEFLAIDQTLKLNADITRGRQQAAGIEKYIWTTAGDERVRETHQELDGETYNWDDPPVTNDDGDKNHPGEDYRCRCVAFPVLPELEEGDEDGGGDKEPPEPRAPAEPTGGEEEPDRFAQGVHAASVAFSGVAEHVGAAVVSGLGAADLAILREAPLGHLEVAKKSRVRRKPVNGWYDFRTRELNVAAARAPSTYGGGELKPGASWSISTLGKTERDAAQRTLVHELGHHVHRSSDQSTGGGPATSIIARAYNQAKQAGSFITQYARANHFEYFAESYAAYRFHPEALLQHDPAGHKMVEEVLRLPRK